MSNTQPPTAAAVAFVLIRHTIDPEKDTRDPTKLAGLVWGWAEGQGGGGGGVGGGQGGEVGESTACPQP